MAQTSTASRDSIAVPEKMPATLTVNGVERKLKLAPWDHAARRAT